MSLRQKATYTETDGTAWKTRMLAFAHQDEYGVFFDSNAHAHTAQTEWDAIAAMGLERFVKADAGMAFEQLKALQNETQDWLFGFFCYDLKNETEQLCSHLPDGIGMPDLFFFQPEIVITLQQGQLEITTLHVSPEAVYEAIMAMDTSKKERQPLKSPVHLTARMPKKEYLAAVGKIKAHIVEGDVYEVNLCQEFYASNVQIDPVAIFTDLNNLAGAPFAAYFKLQDKYLLSASPERFVQKRGQELLSQPIKGTRKRSTDPAEDTMLMEALENSEKDRAENVMIVDLVRNDLSRCCKPGSVRVHDLFKVYSFETVHQMISTVRGTLREAVHLVDALRFLFPMGSMTGAPKVMAMQLIEQYEYSKRGLYSGAVGYITPEGDFDFNVVIRSILYNNSRGYVSTAVGGAIVYDSDPEQEYQECMLKLEAMKKALATISQ